jgi:tyrosinase
VHIDIGGDSGHMQDPVYAAYDPIFFLHHCNVDRQLAIWEGINPSVSALLRCPGPTAWLCAV